MGLASAVLLEHARYVCLGGRGVRDSGFLTILTFRRAVGKTDLGSGSKSPDCVHVYLFCSRLWVTLAFKTQNASTCKGLQLWEIITQIGIVTEL